MPKVSLPELKNFKHRINPEERQGAYGLYFIRPFSLYLTYLSLRIGLSANQVTVLQTITGLCGAVCLAIPSSWAVVTGLLLLQLGFVLDNVDGEVARYRGEVSVTGKYLDTIGHEFVVPSMYFFLGLGTFFRFGTIESVVFGFTAGMFSLRFDVTNMYHESVQLIERKLDTAYEYYSKLQFRDELKVYRRKNEESRIRVIFALFAYPATMNVITVLYLLDLTVVNSLSADPHAHLIYAFLVLYGTLLPIRRVYTISRIVKNREVERKYLSLLEILRSEQGGADQIRK